MDNQKIELAVTEYVDNNVDFSVFKKFNIVFWLLSLPILASIIFLSVYFVMGFDNIQMWLVILVFVVFLGIPVIILGIVSVYWSKKKKQATTKLQEKVLELYNPYLNVNHSDLGLKIVEIRQFMTPDGRFYGFVLETNEGSKIEFLPREVEHRSGTGSNKHKYYITTIEMWAYAENIKNIKLLRFFGGKKTREGSDNNFVSESIDFNNNFRVVTEDKFEAAKFFDPSRIENIINNKQLLKNNNFIIESGCCYYKDVKRTNSYKGNSIADVGKLFSINRNKFIKKIMKDLQRDTKNLKDTFETVSAIQIYEK
ncbi:hypothetical protein NPX79_02540 [Spiroplasma endosymbiont of Anurida maritima]|uniref:hypothetical protein n=1 Tax=Spiroplasma endosymbiont of Anurida maritima TaxID=2967972 RepID=UPI0036D2785A